MGKDVLRSQIRERFRQFTEQELKHKSEKLSACLFHYLGQIASEKNLNRLGVFSPLSDEPVWHYSFNESFEYLQVHMQDEKNLSFHSISIDEMRAMRGVLKLDVHQLSQAQTPEILLVPGVAFTSNCERLGRGKGYYDRYLKGFSGIKVGVAFSFQVVEDVFPEGHDQALDVVITEKNIFKEIK